MADIKHQQLLDAITGVETRLGRRIDGLEAKLESKIDGLEEKIDAIGDTLAGVVDNMVTKEDLKELEARTDAKFDNLELRLGRRIDMATTGRYEH